MNQNTPGPDAPHAARLAERARLVEGLIRDIWAGAPLDPSEALPPPQFSGIFPIQDSLLKPFLERPGLFLILGPAPDFPVLHIGATQGPIRKALEARMVLRGGKGFSWRWDAPSTPPPSHAACVTFPPGKGQIWKLRAHLQARLPLDIPQG